MGAPGPHPRGQGCAQSRERVSLTRRKESHLLQPLGETKTEVGRGLVTGEGGRPSGALTHDLEVYPPPPHPATPSRASILGDGMLQNPEKGPPPWSSPELAVGRHPPNLPSSTRGL